jgi:hypothetical protein
VNRRNALLHRPMEDVELVRAMSRNVGIDLVVERVNRLSADCGELAVELEAFARPKIEGLLGRSRAEMLTQLRGLDPSTITDPSMRAQLEAIQAAGDLDWSDDEERAE